jgi:hypothetical protein
MIADRKKMKLHSLVNLLVLTAAWGAMVCPAVPAAFASEITLQDALVGEEYVSIPVTITTDGADQPASLQFDVTYDAANFAVLGVQVGDAAAQAGKSAVFSESGTGTLTVLVAGLNQNVITDGVIANVSLCPLTQTADMQTLFLDAVVVSDPFGNPIDVFYERPPEVQDMQLDADAGDDARFPSEYALHGEQTDTVSSNSAAMGSLEGNGLGRTAESENAAGTANASASAVSRRSGYGGVTLVEPRGGVSGTATGAPASVRGRNAPFQYGSGDRPGAAVYKQHLRYNTQHVRSDRTSDASRNVTSPDADGAGVSAETQGSGNRRESIVRYNDTSPSPLSRRAVTGYAIAFVIVAGAAVARILLIR